MARNRVCHVVFQHKRHLRKYQIHDADPSTKFQLFLLIWYISRHLLVQTDVRTNFYREENSRYSQKSHCLGKNTLKEDAIFYSSPQLDLQRSRWAGISTIILQDIIIRSVMRCY
ncbi:unnamed protein product [Albugo candida]|uniref:Uncharacterized protein n=1 Tax=Albugo candida TaxID=65357 RepID=A0A024FTC8_9STRA|nr:unnamed protein product [Albugo candida]|eukprot:CCI10353.1 unnamed protein product [Albugo candida]